MQVIPNASGDFLCMGIAWRIFQYKLANIAFFYNSSLKKGRMAKECSRIACISKFKYAQQVQNLK